MDLLSLLFTWAVINIFFFLHALAHLRSHTATHSFIYPWAFITGSFVCEDLLVFSLFHFFTSLLALVLTDFRVWLLLYSSFWLFRSSGEVLYFFLQQFHRPSFPPHYISSHFRPLRPLLGFQSDQKFFIIFQTFFQILQVLSFTSLILILHNWDLLPRS